MTYYGAKELAESFRTVRKNTILVAEDIPEAQYSFKAATDVRTVEKMLTHIALATRFQLELHGSNRLTLEGFDFMKFFQELAATEAQPRTKAEVIEMLKTEGEKWASFLEKITEESLAQVVTMPQGGPLTAETAVKTLLSDVYKSMDNAHQDAYFAGAALAAFHTLTRKQGNPRAIASIRARGRPSQRDGRTKTSAASGPANRDFTWVRFHGSPMARAAAVSSTATAAIGRV